MTDYHDTMTVTGNRTRAFYKPSNWLCVASSAATACLITSVLLALKIRSESVDVVLHYSLVEFWASAWGTREQFAEVHGTMANYPPAAHALAAWIGNAAGSPFLGMQIVAIAAIGTCYSLLFTGSLSRDISASIVSAIIAMIVLYVFRQKVGFFGHELSGNYFFAHVASNAATLIALFALSLRKRSRSELIIIPATVFAFGWLYPMGQIQLAAGATALWLISAYRSWIISHRFPNHQLIIAVAMVLLCIGIFRFHPNYAFMRGVSDHNGEIIARFDVNALVAAACALLALSTYMVWDSSRGHSTLIFPWFFPTIGLAVSSTCLVHAVVYFATEAGSDYAFRKHIYSVLTILVFQISIVSASALLGRAGVTNRLWRLRATILLLPTFCSVLASLIALYPKSRSALPLLRAQEDIRLFGKQVQIPYSRTASQLHDLSPFENFVIGAVELRVPDEAARLVSDKSKLPTEVGLRHCIKRSIQLVVIDCAP